VREQRRVGEGQHRARRRRVRERGQVALVRDDQARLCGVESLAQVLGAQLLVARERHGADPKAGDHRQQPLGAVSDQRHHDVAAADPACCQGAGEPRGAIGDLAEAPIAPAPVPGNLDERAARGRSGVDDVTGEVQRSVTGRERTAAALIGSLSMGLMTGTGPFGRNPAGHFNFEPSPPGRALYLDPSPKRVRAAFAGETVVDSRRAMMLHESGHQPIYYFPPADVRSDLLERSDRHTHCPKKGDASYYTIRVGEHVLEAGAWYYPEPLPGAPPIQDLIAFYFNRMDHWYEEDEEIFVHPRDPYHRVDVLDSDVHIRVSLDGELLAESGRARALFETSLPTRWYLPAEDVIASLERSDTITRCPYKGAASYCSVRLADGELDRDLVWYYADPLPEVGRIAGLLCFFNERVDIELDGELQERPASPWSHGVRSEAQNAPAVQTRG